MEHEFTSVSIAEMLPHWIDGWFDLSSVEYDKDDLECKMTIECLDDSITTSLCSHTIRASELHRIVFTDVADVDVCVASDEGTLWISDANVDKTGITFQCSQGTVVVRSHNLYCLVSKQSSPTRFHICSFLGIKFVSPSWRSGELKS